MMSRENAQALALEALSWVLGNEDLCQHFMAEAGLQPADLRQGADDPAFLEGVLDFVMQQDLRVRDFSSASGHPPMAVAEARARLAGPGAMHWT